MLKGSQNGIVVERGKQDSNYTGLMQGSKNIYQYNWN